MTILRGAVFGCGMISEYHLRGWSRIPEVEIVALGNRTIERAVGRRDQFAPNASVYSDLAAMLEGESLDFVDILTAPALHREHCELARRAGVHIICQKPLADTLENARAIAAGAAGYTKLLAVHENHRYRPWFQQARAHVLADDFGPISLARFVHLNATGPDELYKQQSDTGIMLEYGTHLVDMMRSVLGEPDRVYARMHQLNPAIRGESLVHAMFEYPNVTAIVEVGWKDTAMTQGSVLLGGARGEAWYEGTLTRGDEGRFRIACGHDVVVDVQLSPTDAYVESFYLLQRECVDAMIGRRDGVVQTVEEHMRTLECTFAAYESARTGKVIEIW